MLFRGACTTSADLSCASADLHKLNLISFDPLEIDLQHAQAYVIEWKLGASVPVVPAPRAPPELYGAPGKWQVDKTALQLLQDYYRYS
jgi:hypothetical protein